MKRIIYSCLAIGLTITMAGCHDKADNKKSESETKGTEQHKDNKITKGERKKLKKDMLAVSGKVAKKQDLAMSNRYLSNGNTVEGDFYAMSSDGEVQVIDNDKPGAKHFKIHNLVGVSMYTSSEGTKGYDESAKRLSNVEGYQAVANMNKPVRKYLFADNGKVYYYTFKPDDTVTLSSGFSYKDFSDKDPNLKPNVVFKETHNKTLKKEWKNKLKQYKDVK